MRIYYETKLESETSDITYHGTKSELIRDSIMETGFSSPKGSIFISDSQEDAEGYGKFIIKIYGLNSLNLKEVIPTGNGELTDTIKKYSKICDGIKYRFDEYHSYNYEIFNISELNKLKREKL